MTFIFWPGDTVTLDAAVISSPRKSRLVEQVPGMSDGQGRAYPRRLWNVASTMYWTCSCCAACTQVLAVQPPAFTSFSQAAQLLWAGPVRSPQCRNRPPVAARRYSCRGLVSSALADGTPNTESAPSGSSTAARAVIHRRKRLFTGALLLSGRDRS